MSHLRLCWQGVAHLRLDSLQWRKSKTKSPFCRCECTQRLLFTFCWYLWWYLLLVVSASLLPVPPLLLRQSRRHADQAGDRLPWAGWRSDFQRFGEVKVNIYWAFVVCEAALRLNLTCSVDFWPSGNYLRRCNTFRNVISCLEMGNLTFNFQNS